MEKLLFSKIRDVKSPCRGTEKSAGIDFYVPKFNAEFLEAIREKNKEFSIKGNMLQLKSLQQILIPSGIKVKIPENHVLIAFNKSGISTKFGLKVGACVIDEDYQGEIHINLFNDSRFDVIITEDQKIIQFLLLPISYIGVEEKSIEHLYDIITTRGEGGFGSTDEKLA